MNNITPNPDMYLSESIQIEPLSNGWYAWGYLISPATAAMVTANLHVPVMESFLAYPDLHRRAVTEQSMKGGMVIDYDGDPSKVQELLDYTRSELAYRIDFAGAVRSLNEHLAAHTDGRSLEQLYKEVPEILRGYVELVYDLQHRPSFRFIEGLLYASRYYDENLQSLRFLFSASDQRPFVLSSPRFADARSIDLCVPFRSELVDKLMALRTVSARWDEIETWLRQAGLSDGECAKFRDCLTSTAPYMDPDRNFSGPGVRVRYFGHATVLVEAYGVSFLLDPIVSTSSSDGPERFTYNDLPDKIDYVLLTHNHQDHVALESLLQLRHKIGCVVVPRGGSGSLQDPSLKQMLRMIGFDNVLELDEMESLSTPVGELVGIPFFGEHADLDIRSKLAYFIRADGRGLLFLADSNALEPAFYEAAKRRIGNVDAMFIGLECDGAPLSWLYGPLYTRPLQRAVDQSRRLNSSNCESAMAIIDRLKPDRVFIYAMGLEPWLGYISSIAYEDDSRPIVESNRLLDLCSQRNLPAERLYLKKEFVL